jgi:hypothetical protein
MASFSAALQDLRKALEGLVADHATMRQQLHSILRNGSSVAGPSRGRPAHRTSVAQGGPKKRGRAFKFGDGQATEFRKQVEGGKSAMALAKELKISLPTMYNTLKRVGWLARRGRPPSRAVRAARPTPRSGGSKKRGRPFKFSDEQTAEFRKQVEGGKSTRALAKEHKVSLPTMYSTLKRAGWRGRPGRKARAA